MCVVLGVALALHVHGMILCQVCQGSNFKSGHIAGATPTYATYAVLFVSIVYTHYMYKPSQLIKYYGSHTHKLLWGKPVSEAN